MGRLFHTAGKFHPDAETEGAESLRNQSPELVIEKTLLLNPEPWLLFI